MQLGQDASSLQTSRQAFINNLLDLSQQLNAIVADPESGLGAIVRANAGIRRIQGEIARSDELLVTRPVFPDRTGAVFGGPGFAAPSAPIPGVSDDDDGGGPTEIDRVGQLTERLRRQFQQELALLDVSEGQRDVQEQLFDIANQFQAAGLGAEAARENSRGF